MMRGVQVELPAAAQAKLDELVMLRDLALDASRTTNVRLQQALSQGDVDPRLRAKLEAETARATDKHRVLAMLTSKVNQWWAELRLPPTHRLECQPPYNHVQLQPGETLAEAVAKVRTEIADVKRQIAAVKSAPLKTVSQMEALAIYIDGLMQRAKPRVGFDVKGNARVLWTEDLVASKDDLLGVLAFILGPETIAASFARSLEQEDEPANAVTPTQRAERLAELAEALLKLERRECAWVECDASILPRADVSPLAFLTLRIAQAAAQAAQVA
jgi:hypothetical protein